MFVQLPIRQHGEGASRSGGAKKARLALAVVARGGVVVAGLVGRKADAFAALLDGTSKAGTADPALANLAKITQRLSSVPQPSPAFKAALRQQLVHAASTTAAAGPTAGALHVPHPRVSPGHGAGASGAAGSGASGTSSAIMGLGKSAPIWIKIFSGIAAATVAGTGVGVGAHRALPGDPFYGIKKQVEAVQLDLASGTADKAKTQLGFAHARINELKQLIKRRAHHPDLAALVGDRRPHPRPAAGLGGERRRRHHLADRADPRPGQQGIHRQALRRAAPAARELHHQPVRAARRAARRACRSGRCSR